MAVYNGLPYIEEAVHSILKQTYSSFEFIIVDDGSVDGTSELLQQLAAGDDRIIVLKNERNIGLTCSLNRALRVATGEFIARMDADDVAVRNRFEQQIAYLDEHPSVGLVGTSYNEIDADGTELAERHLPAESDILRRIMIQYNPFLHASVLFRRGIIEEIGGYDESYKKAQDYDLWLRMVGVTEVANLPAILMQKRYQGGNISVRGEEVQLACAIRSRKSALKRGQYSWWCYVYLVRPWVALHTPYRLRQWVREVLLSSNLYGSSSAR